MEIEINDEIDITDEVNSYTTKELANLLLFLHKNNFGEIYFDGYDACITVNRKRIIQVTSKNSEKA